MIRVLLVAGSPVVRAGLEVVLASNPALEVVGQASGGAMLLEQVELTHPDVVLCDLEQRDDPIVALRALGDGRTAPALVLLTEESEAPWIADALRAGVRAVLPRRASTEEICGAIQAAATGVTALHGEVLQALLAHLPVPARAEGLQATQSLTGREVEVLGMLAEGLGNKIIARRLGISEHTVKFHVGSILSKLHASSRTEAVTIGARQGLIML